MVNNRLVMIVADIDESVARLNAKFNDGIFNKDKSKRQIDGYVVDENENPIIPKTLCQDKNYLLYLCRGAADPVAAVHKILDSSYEIKPSKYKVMKYDINSEWYNPEVELI